MTTVSRRTFGAAALAVLAGLGISPATAQDYPNQDIRFICAFPAGSGADVLVRFFAEKTRPVFNRNIIVDNRAGAGGNIAQEFVARAKPDGYTIFVHAGSAVAANQHLFKKPPIDAAKQIEVLATINRQPFMLVVTPDKPWKNVADLTAYLKQKGSKATYGYAAPTGQIMGELYKAKMDLPVVEVAYRTAPDSLGDQVNGTVDYGMHDPVYSLANMREGRLKILAVSTAQRLAAVPDLPTMTEQGIPMDLTGWWAAMVPVGVPAQAKQRIHEVFKQVVGSDETKKFLNSFGGDPLIETPAQGQARLLADIKNWGEYVRLAKIEPQ